MVFLVFSALISLSKAGISEFPHHKKPISTDIRERLGAFGFRKPIVLQRVWGTSDLAQTNKTRASEIRAHRRLPVKRF